MYFQYWYKGAVMCMPHGSDLKQDNSYIKTTEKESLYMSVFLANNG